MSDTARKSHRVNGGYTLIQLAISIMILGLMIAPAAMIYANYKQTMDRETTYKNLSAVIDNIGLRRNITGDYPCPAPMTAGRDDPAYGGALADCPGTGNTGIPVGSCSDGICVEEGRGGARVLVGAVPFRELQLDEPRSYDAYGSRLLYAVTESMVDENTFDPSLGAIYIDGENGESVVEPAGNASFIIISPGPDRTGSFTIEGVSHRDCTGAGRDVANCNPGFNGGTPKAEARYAAAFENSVQGGNFFDDQVMYFSQLDTPYWRQTTDDAANIQDLSPHNVGIGTLDPAADLTVTSSGSKDSLRVNDALLTNEICHNGVCFDPEVFTTNPTLQCPPNQHMIGIQNSQPICEPDTTPIAVTCPDGLVLLGLNADGTPNCRSAPPRSCPATSTSVCAPNDASAGDTRHNQTVTFNRGDCRTATFRCNNGNWQATGTSGQCSFTPPVPDTYSNCGIACPQWHTGTYCNKYRVVCTGTISLGNTRAQDCTCVGGTVNETGQCSSLRGSGWTGTATRVRTISPPNCTSSYSAWDLSACRCSSNRANGTIQWVRNGNCPSGYTGIREREQRWDTSTCSWADTGATRDTCTCNTTPITRQQPHVCDDPVCEVSSTPDIFTTPIDPTTCRRGVETRTTVGTCSNRSFKWVMQTATGATGTTSIKFDSPCSCSDKKTGRVVACGTPTNDPNNYMYRCICQ